MKKILLLGGTADGRILAETLHNKGFSVIYSIAGLVRTPTVPCDIISGGFTQYGGLEKFIAHNHVGAILDVTHPYAQTMSSKASVAAKACAIPYWRFHREEWQPTTADQWQSVNHWDEALALLNKKNHWPVSSSKTSSKIVSKKAPLILLTAGQLTRSFLEQLPAPPANQKHILRTAVAPKIDLPKNIEWIKAIGPFKLEDEQALMQRHQTTILLSKNSGGDATVAKLQAARELGVSVIMLERPLLPPADQLLLNRQDCCEFIEREFSKDKSEV